MAKINLTISGDTPSLKNSKQIFRGKGGRPFITSSNASKEWRSKAVWELLAQSKGKRDITYPLKVKLTFWRSTKRRFDLDNGAGGVLDALVEAGIIEDDSFNHIDTLHLLYGGVDKENPRVDIEITKKC